LALILKDLEPNFLNAVAVAVEMGPQCRRRLAQFGCCGIRVNQQTPLCALNGACLNGVSEGVLE
jgi:hypothetical protein